MFVDINKGNLVDNSQNEVIDGNDIREGVKAINRDGQVIVGLKQIPKLSDATFTSNGTYTVPDGYNGYGTVKVDTPVENIMFASSAMFGTEYYYNSSVTYLLNPSNVGIVYRNLVSIYLPSCKYIAPLVFSEQINLKTVSLPNLKMVTTKMFYSCPELEGVYLPKVSRLYPYAINRCSNLSYIDLPECEVVEYSAITSCPKLMSLKLPKCRVIDWYAFYGCENLTSLNLPNCSYINYDAFRYCYGLKEVSLMSTSYVYINNQAFRDCPSLTSIYVPMSMLETYTTSRLYSSYWGKFVGV